MTKEINSNQVGAYNTVIQYNAYFSSNNLLSALFRWTW